MTELELMERFSVIDYGFNDPIQNDDRLSFDGLDYNDFMMGIGNSRYEAFQFAIELIKEDGILLSQKLMEEVEKASKKIEFDKNYNLAIRYYIDKTNEEHELSRNFKEAKNKSKTYKEKMFLENPKEFAVF